ncbi:MAG: arylmalonate decarboxylase [Rhodospirillaceae bacterium]|jgi:maleate isomerase|nr:arylmalonate decarboxylase [Rhodospirillaceae bacterium]MBT3493562.1 arylmalonate decarboxylase [Rhodospirillaceae bacterium]MBT3779281.1 arylmalonate decarboxylase [Rhodospirillaceae bacterium]MBT3976901.1 arylmalonate decarboxylase [Rhodospirillaceae bacterium]MBT4169029.1 arylmalonate decarboxylase [Rhodospirillaceae bacterium]
MNQIRHQDRLGWRAKIGVVTPSTNTIVEPEFHAMAPLGVTNHTARFLIPNMALNSNEDFEQLVVEIKATLDDAIDGLTPAAVDHVIIGISAESFWDGADGADKLQKRLEAKAGCTMTLGSAAARSALQAVGAKRLGVVTPYWPVADDRVRHYFGECGFEVVALKGLKANSPVNIAEQSEETLRQAMVEVNTREVDTIIQVGTNLGMAQLAGEAERWLGKPVIAINTALYWHALRQMGINDKIPGWGRLLTDF